jgi:integrase
MQVLGRVLSWGVGRGLLGFNAAEGVEQLYSGGRADQIWTAGEIDRFVAAAKTSEVGFIVRLACLTGLRRSDLAKLAWSHVTDTAIIMPTGKSRGRRNTVVPLIADAKTLLAEVRAQQVARHEELCATAAKKRRPMPPVPTTVLSNTRGKPWTWGNRGMMPDW